MRGEYVGGGEGGWHQLVSAAEILLEMAANFGASAAEVRFFQFVASLSKSLIMLSTMRN